MSADPDLFKAAFRGHPAGVALITARTADGPSGLTASSVASLSVDPPALSFSVTRATGSAGAILSADSYVVHLLAGQHAALARAFAGRLERELPEPGLRVDRAYRLAFGRPATVAERNRAHAFVERHGLAGFCHVLLNANEFLLID